MGSRIEVPNKRDLVEWLRDEPEQFVEKVRKEIVLLQNDLVQGQFYVPNNPQETYRKAGELLAQIKGMRTILELQPHISPPQ